MPFIYKPKAAPSGDSGMTGSFVDGALIIGLNNTAASMPNGAPGEVLSISENGKLVWAEAEANGQQQIKAAADWYAPDAAILKDGEFGIERRELNGKTAY